MVDCVTLVTRRSARMTTAKRFTVLAEVPDTPAAGLGRSARSRVAQIFAVFAVARFGLKARPKPTTESDSEDSESSGRLTFVLPHTPLLFILM